MGAKEQARWRPWLNRVGGLHLSLWVMTFVLVNVVYVSLCTVSQACCSCQTRESLRLNIVHGSFFLRLLSLQLSHCLHNKLLHRLYVCKNFRLNSYTFHAEQLILSCLETQEMHMFGFYSVYVMPIITITSPKTHVRRQRHNTMKAHASDCSDHQFHRVFLVHEGQPIRKKCHHEGGVTWGERRAGA